MKKITFIKFALLAVFASLYLTSSVSAATYTVTSGVDGGNNGICETSGNTCTLRDAITEANASPDDDVIVFNLTLPTTIFLGARLIIANNGSLTINGAGANNLFVSGSNAVTVFEISSGAVVEINNLTIFNGKEVIGSPGIGSFGGGIWNNGGNLTLIGMVVSNNVSPQRNGGGIFNGCPTGCTTNSAPTITVINSTISNNSAGNLGGGIFNPTNPQGSSVTLTNSTVSNNTAGNFGGGIYNFQANLTLNSTTVSNNTATNFAGGIYNRGVLTANNSIIANSTTRSAPGGDCDNRYGVAGITYSLVETTLGCNISATSTNLTGDPNLGPLQLNGGSTPTHALLPGSPAIDKGNSTLTNDQRGLPRPVDNPTAANGSGNLADMGAFELQTPAAGYLVNSIADPGDGTCDVAECTLREAITGANNDPGNDVINFDPNVFGVDQTITINTPSRSRFIIANNGSLKINGTRADILKISGNNAITVFEINSGAIVEINNLTVTAGKEVIGQTFGGGIWNNGGTLTVQNSVVSDSEAVRSGGGIYNGCPTGCVANNTATLNVINSTVSGNTAGNSGGGIFNARGIATLSNVTVSDNTSGNGAGGLGNSSSQSSLTIYSSTITDNTAAVIGGGVLNVAGNALYIYNTIIAGNFVTNPNNQAARDCFNSAAALISFTLVGAGGCVTNGVNNNLTGDPNLGPLTLNNGGLTPTHALLPGSIAIDKGNSALSTDQRGFIRPVDLANVANATGGNGADMGAYEFQVSATVNSTNDPGNGICDVAECTLREAIALANASAEDDIITFSLIPSSVITLNGTQLEIAANGSLTIDGRGASNLTISGNNASRVFYLQPGSNATITNLTVRNGNGTGGGVNGTGGGILIEQGTLTLSNSTVRNNSTAFGGGIFNHNGILTLNNSTVSGNSVTNGGGGIYNEGGGTLNNSTISGNSAGSGGGIENFNNTITINSTTIAKNSASVGAGTVFNSGSGTTNLNNSIIADTPSGLDCVRSGGTVNASYSQIEGGLACVNGTNSNNQINDPALAPLAFYGGSTQTHALTINSTAIDKGSSFGLTTDQRGLTRPVDLAGFANGSGDLADIGAYEVQTNELTATPTGDNVTVIPQFIATQRGFEPPTNDVSVTFDQVTEAGATSFVSIADPLTVGTPPAGYSILPFETAYDISTTATYTAPVVVCFVIDSVNIESDFSRVRILHGEDGILVDRTILAPNSPAPDFATRTVCASVTSLSPFVPAIVNPPTAASVSVSGRVLSAKNSRGVPNATVQLSDQNGNVRTARTNSFGYYFFNNVEVGQTFVINANHKRYQFDPRIIAVTEELSSLDITARNNWNIPQVNASERLKNQ